MKKVLRLNLTNEVHDEVIEVFQHDSGEITIEVWETNGKCSITIPRRAGKLILNAIKSNSWGDYVDADLWDGET